MCGFLVWEAYQVEGADIDMVAKALVVLLLSTSKQSNQLKGCCTDRETIWFYVMV